MEHKRAGAEADKPMSGCRGRYIGDADLPQMDQEGVVCRAPGHFDPDSTQYGAWLFTPDAGDISYYIHRDDWEEISRPVHMREDFGGAFDGFTVTSDADSGL